jgi:hypothetical protein
MMMQPPMMAILRPKRSAIKGLTLPSAINTHDVGSPGTYTTGKLAMDPIL